MKNKFEISGLNLILILLFLTVSCKSYRNVEKLDPTIQGNQEGYFVAESEFEKIKNEEKILVELVDGKKYYMYYGSFSDKILRGEVWKDFRSSIKIDSYNIEIPHNKIKNLRILRPNAGLTIPLGILGVTFLIALIVFATEGFAFPW